MTASYRARQFFRAVRAAFTPPNPAPLAPYLTKAQRELFQQLLPFDQQHALDVFHTLQSWGYADEHLLRAALLHDVGKIGGTLRLWHRVPIVLLNLIHPCLIERLAAPNPHSWRYAFYIHQTHAARGAELTQSVGVSSLTVWLIAHHHDDLTAEHSAVRKSILWRTHRQLLAALQRADNEN